MPIYTEYCRNKLPADFTGVVYCDHGKLPYAAVVNGKILNNKRRMNRWFATSEAAERAISLISAR